MHQASLVSFALASHADFAYLKAQIDLSATAGHVYDFPNCQLLSACTPATATVGFWKDKQGYLLYVRPSVSYRGTNTVATQLFRTGRVNFSSFDALEEYLKRISVPAPTHTPLPRATAATASAPKLEPHPPSQSQLSTALGESVLGQALAVDLVASRLSAHATKCAPARPLSLLFHGPTGVGKSELGKLVAPVLNRFLGPNTYQFIWTELNTFTEQHSVYRLTGAPPGYVGYDDAPVFESVQQNPRTIFMFDELDKAHPEVLKTFMSVLDEGRCSARKPLPDGGRELDFRRCIFLFTTNADLSGTTRSMGFVAPSTVCTPSSNIISANEVARRAMAAQGVLREIAGRFGGFIPFQPLTPSAREAITAKQISALGREYGLTLTAIAPALIHTVWLQAESCGSFSVRSHTAVLERLLSPLFASRAGLGSARLEGTADQPQLV